MFLRLSALNLHDWLYVMTFWGVTSITNKFHRNTYFWGRPNFWSRLKFWGCVHFWGRLHYGVASNWGHSSAQPSIICLFSFCSRYVGFIDLIQINDLIHDAKKAFCLPTHPLTHKLKNPQSRVKRYARCLKKKNTFIGQILTWKSVFKFFEKLRIRVKIGIFS